MMSYNTEKSRNKMEYINHLKKIAVILITVSVCSIITWWSHEIKTGYIRNDGRQEESTEVRQQANITEGGELAKVRIIKDAIWPPVVGPLLGTLLDYTVSKVKNTSQANKIRVLPALVGNNTEDRMIGSNMFIGF